MKAAAKDLYPVVITLSPAEIVGNFFDVNSAESVRNTMIYLFKAWAFCPVEKRPAFSDEEIASFLDQLIEMGGEPVWDFTLRRYYLPLKAFVFY